MPSRQAERRARIVRGTKNVFADLGFPDAAERQGRLRLAHRVVQSLDRRKISRAKSAVAFGMCPAGLKALRSYKLGTFSIERLMGLLAVLGDDVEIVVGADHVLGEQGPSVWL